MVRTKHFNGPVVMSSEIARGGATTYGKFRRGGAPCGGNRDTRQSPRARDNDISQYSLALIFQRCRHVARRNTNRIFRNMIRFANFRPGNGSLGPKQLNTFETHANVSTRYVTTTLAEKT